MLIARTGYFIREIHLDGHLCKYCGASIPGVWGVGTP
jgi:hypothetical protein